jgi:putative endonuclease
MIFSRSQVTKEKTHSLSNLSSRACRGISSVATCDFVRDYFVYTLSNNAQVLYIGVTKDLYIRISQHLDDRDPSSFVSRYNLDRLVHGETFPTARQAIAREKQFKGWSREKKKKLIREMNPMWKNLLDEKNGLN